MLISEGEGDGWYEAEVIEAKAEGLYKPCAGGIGPTCRSSCADASTWLCFIPTLPRLKRREGGGVMKTQTLRTRSSAEALDATARIRTLNDAFRRSFAGGQVVKHRASLNSLKLIVSPSCWPYGGSTASTLAMTPTANMTSGRSRSGVSASSGRSTPTIGRCARAHQIPPTQR